MLHTTVEKLRRAKFSRSYGDCIETLSAQYAEDARIPLDKVLDLCGIIYAYAILSDDDTICEPENIRRAAIEQYDTKVRPIVIDHNISISGVKEKQLIAKMVKEYAEKRRALFRSVVGAFGA